MSWACAIVICLECGERQAVPVPRSILPICVECAREMSERRPPLDPPPRPARAPQKPQLDFFK